MEAKNKQTIVVDLRVTKSIPMPQFIQQDTNVIEFVVKNNGADADLSSIGNIVVYYKRPDRTVIDRMLESVGNVVTYELGSAEMEYPGIGELELQFFSADNRYRLSLSRFKVHVTPSLSGIDYIEAEDLSVLQQLFVKVDDLISGTNDAGTYATAQGDYAKVQGDAAKVEINNLTTLKQDVEAATGNANGATNAANTAAENANSKAQFAQEQGNFAKQEADRAKAETDRLVGTDVSILDNKIRVVESGLAEKASQTDLNTANTNIEKKADTTYVDTKVAAVASGSPKGTYASLSALQTAFPTGATGIYITADNGHWYYWNSSVWTDGGVYQAQGINTSLFTSLNKAQVTSDIVNYTEGFNKNEITQNMFFNSGASGITPSSGIHLSNPMYVTAGQQIYIRYTNTSSHAYRIASTKKDFVYVDTGIVYLNGDKSGGITVTASATGYFFLAFVASEINDVVIRTDNVDYTSLTDKMKTLLNNDNFYPIINKDVNLFDSTNVIRDKFFGTASGLTTSMGVCISNPIPVSSGDSITLKFPDTRSHAFRYTADKNIFKYLDSSTTYIPSGDKSGGYTITAGYSGYFYLAFFDTEINNVQIVINGKTRYAFNDFYKGIEPIKINPYKNKTITAVGDSITQGFGTQKNYLTYLKEKLELKVVNNYGIGGSTIATGQDSIATRITSVANADVILVFAGTNDFGYKPTALGTQYTLDSNNKMIPNTDTTTFYGALNVLCNSMLTTFSKSKLLLCTPIHREKYDTQPTELQPNSLGIYMYQYIEAMRKVANFWGIELCDLYTKCKLNPNNPAIKSAYFSSTDGLHPNADGHEVIADEIIRTLLS